MKPSECPSSTRLPRPRTPLPAYITVPSAAATTGAPGVPSVSIPLVLLLKPWMILPFAGQPQLIRLASLARAAGAAGGGVTGVAAGVGDGAVATAGGCEGMGVPPSRRNTCPMRSWVGSLILFR